MNRLMVAALTQSNFYSKSNHVTNLSDFIVIKGENFNSSLFTYTLFPHYGERDTTTHEQAHFVDKDQSCQYVD